MDIIKVDPKLFVTCRLCLEDLGHYQIVPSVQEQIKYCYDIDVKPFDGLPQLLCMKCKDVLNNFFTTKKDLCEKQSNLRAKLATSSEINEICVQPQQDTVSSSQQTSENLEKKKKPKWKIKSIINSSESEDSCQTTKFKKKPIKKLAKWNWEGFRMEFICSICDSRWPSLRSLHNHSRSHAKLTTRFSSIFRKNCLVNLEKIDKKPNFTGLSDVVVHNSNEIIQNSNAFYYVRYFKENHACEGEEGSNKESSENTYQKRHLEQQSSDTDDEIVTKPMRRKRRILTHSSNETVVIETNNNKRSDNDEEPITKDSNEAQSTQITHDECINIDDSSDSDGGTSHLRAKQPLEAKLEDYKIIQGIIKMCVHAYHRKNESTDKCDNISSTELHLRNKVLSIGRKIINREGCNWTGLLKYLEHKNLGIVWSTKASPNKETNYIRIITKLRGPEVADDSYGWVLATPVTAPSKTSTSLKTATCKTKSVTIPKITLDAYKTAPVAVRSTVSFPVPYKASSAVPNMVPISTATPMSISTTNPVAVTTTNPLAVFMTNPVLVSVGNPVPVSVTSTASVCFPNSVSAAVCNSVSSPAPNVVVSNTAGGSIPSIMTDHIYTTSLNTNQLTLGVPENENRSQSMDSAVLLFCSTSDSKSKLLNANPVANPKQLPRKLGQGSEQRLLKAAIDQNKVKEQCASNNTDTDICMPIITSTTSLAVTTAIQNQNDSTPALVTTNTETPAPRIKVKPVTELMSERMLNSLRKEQSAPVSSSNALQNQNENINNIIVNQNVWAPQSVANLYIPNIVPHLTVANQQIQLVPLSCVNVAPIATSVNSTNKPPVKTNKKEEYVVLSTVELPNTTTNSPFNYLKNLLQIHNLTLLDPQETLRREFVCLIKFKAQFKQEPINDPVLLRLSLFCFEREFCIKVKDIDQNDLDINGMTSNWQWEVLNVFFREDLVDKVLQNAQKVSQETRNNTNKFLCLLKSIDFKKLS